MATPRPVLTVVVFFALLIVAAVSVYAWFYLYSPCGVNAVKAASAALIDQARLYEQAYELAVSVPPLQRVGPVMQMQQTLMDTREVVVPACLQTAKIELINSMEHAIRAILAFMAQETDATVSGLMQKSTAHLDNFTTELEAVNKCAPLCIR